MISLLKLHWEFLRYPSFCLEKYIRNWSIGLGFWLYVLLFIASDLRSAEQLRMRLDVIAYFQDGYNTGAVYGWTVFTTIITLIFAWEVIPFLIRVITKKSKKEFDPNLYRKLAFYSPLAYLIFTVLFILPINVILMVISSTGVQGTGSILFVSILAIVAGFLSLWTLVLIASHIVILCKGLSRYFGLNAWQIILVQFLAPSIVFGPIYLLKFPKFWEFVTNYAVGK